MIEKYLIKLDDVTFGFKYNSSDGIVILGCHKIFRPQAESIIKKAFKNPRTQVILYPTRNLIRFTFKSREIKRIDNGLKYMRENGFVVEAVKTLEFIR